MTLDLWCLLLLGTFAFTGFFQGASGQVARVLAMACATVIGYALGPFVGAKLLASWPASVRTVLGGLILGVVAYLIVATLLRRLARRIVDRNAWGKADRGMGFFLGAVQGAYLAWILVLALPLINIALASHGSRVRFHTDGSWAARFAAAHPLPVQPPNEKPLKDAEKLIKNIEKSKALDLPTGSGT